MRNTKNKLFKIYDFREEYGNSPDKVNHIIATDLPAHEAIRRQAEVGINVDELKPFIMMPLDHVEVFNAFFRNEKKHERRQRLYGEVHGYEDGAFELHHKEYADRLDYIEEIFAYEKKVREEEIKRLEEAMEKLTEIQRRRVRMHYYERLDIHQIAAREQRSWSAVEKSIKIALKKIQKTFQKWV